MVRSTNGLSSGYELIVTDPNKSNYVVKSGIMSYMIVTNTEGLTNIIIAVSNMVDFINGTTNQYVRTNEQRQLNFLEMYSTNAYRNSTNTPSEKELIDKNYLDKRLNELAPQALWGASNAHPYVATHASLWDVTPPYTYVMTNVLVNGSNYLGSFTYTNAMTTSYVPSGLWQLESYSYKSGVSDLRLRCYLNIVTADGLSNQVLISELSDLVNGTYTYNSMHGHSLTNYYPSVPTTQTNWYYSVQYWGIQDGIPADTLYTMIRSNAPSSHLDTPGIEGSGGGGSTYSGLTTNAVSGLWELDFDLSVTPLERPHAFIAGLWQLNPDGSLSPNSLDWYDTLWTTNGSGDLITR